MIKYAVLFLFLVHAYENTPCCKDKERLTAYLDIATDLISKVKNNIPECPKCPDPKAMDCSEWYERGYIKSGVYKIHPINRRMPNKSLDVFCDMDTEGGGWTVIQRRGNFGSPYDYFNQSWSSYKNGFGDISRDFWLGNDNIFALTNQKLSSIRFDIQAKDLVKVYASFSDVWIDDEANWYMLHISNYSGTAGNNMQYHNGRNFSTTDQNNSKKKHCAQEKSGGWWWDYCTHSTLNGLYDVTSNGLCWEGFRKCDEPPLIWTEIKIRPKNFPRQIFS